MQIETFAGETTSSKVRTDGGEAASPAIIVTDRTDDESGDGVESDDSKEFMLKKVVGHTVFCKIHMYIYIVTRFFCTGWFTHK